MQLPRGTFREIKKNETVGSILLEIERMKFSGICSISYGPNMGTLVFKSGKCILSKFLGKQGDAGWNELQNILDEEVDAALSSLDEAQIQLSLEFNKACKIIKVGVIQSQQVPAPLSRHEYHKVTRHELVKKPTVVSHFADPAAPAPKPTTPLKVPTVSEHKPHLTPAHTTTGAITKPASHIAPSPGLQSPKSESPEDIAVEKQPGPDQGDSSFNSDIETLDTMDMENITDKIRNDCKTLIKQLHLEHLMER